jgi:hypothetical protein
MPTNFTENYTPRVVYNSNYPIGHPNNEKYVESLAVWGMARIKASAQPYHKKHKGVRDKGKKGKLVTVTIEDLKEIIIKTNGKSPEGNEIYFGPTGYLLHPSKSQEYGFITDDERRRFPSWDRIDSSKDYTKENLQLTTKAYNLGKSTNDERNFQSLEKATLKWHGVELEITNPTASLLANTMKQLVRN